MAADIAVWNPSFDVTPAQLIEGIITERGVVPKAAAGSTASFDIRGWLDQTSTAANGSSAAANGGTSAAADTAAKKLATLPGFQALNCDTVKDYVAARPQLAQHVGSPDTKGSWTGERGGAEGAEALRAGALRCVVFGLLTPCFGLFFSRPPSSQQGSAASACNAIRPHSCVTLTRCPLLPPLLPQCARWGTATSTSCTS